MAKRREDEMDRMEKDAVPASGSREDHLPDVDGRRGPGRPPGQKPQPWRCPKCGCETLKVLSTRHGSTPYEYRIRVRECAKCGKKFTTREGLDDLGRMMEGPQRDP